MANREALRQRLLVTFKVEAREHTSTLSSSLIQLEKEPPGPGRAKLIELVFREAHSLKGAARAVSLGPMESVCQALESVFSAMKRETLLLSSELLDVLLAAVRVLEELLRGLENGDAVTLVPIGPVVAALRASLEEGTRVDSVPSASNLSKDVVSPPSEPATLPAFEAGRVVVAPGVELGRTPAPTIDMVRVPTRKLDDVRRQAEELFSERLGLIEHADEAQRLQQVVTDFRKRWRKGVRELKGPARERSGSRSAPAPDAEVWNLIESGNAFLEEIERRTALLGRSARRNQRNVATRAEQLLGDSLDLLMLPCSWLLDGFAHLVRDLGRDQRKEVALAIHGSAIEVDRRILTELRDPFLHALRNAVDHGIEPPAERLARGKPSAGTISISIEQVQGNRIEIRITDDGRGIDPAKVRASAQKLGLLEGDAATEIEPRALLDLVFKSELSTSPIITDLSGRGLGLAIFREKVEKLGGSASITSEPLAGTTVSMLLPVSIATFRGVVVRVRDRVFVLPTASVERVLGVRQEQIRSAENRAAVELDGGSVALVDMGHVLGMQSAPTAPADGARLPLVLLRAEATRVAFVVDEILGEKDALAKSLGPQLRKLPGVLGASQVGSGKIALILEPRELIRRATELEPSSLAPLLQRLDRAETPKRSILVAEDSITSRTLLKSILESAGYTVSTAVDGVDAFEKLRGGDFDLLVSDVDMPRLNGLGLTQRVRADKKLSELPVVLVTSLEAPEDRARGIDVGADAYLVKQSFDQSNLLAAIERLL